MLLWQKGYTLHNDNMRTGHYCIGDNEYTIEYKKVIYVVERVDHLKKFNPTVYSGTYEGCVKFINDLLKSYEESRY